MCGSTRGNYKRDRAKQGDYGTLGAQIIYTFREGNQLADFLDNTTIEQEGTQQYHIFQDLPIKERKILNTYKPQLPSIRIT